MVNILFIEDDPAVAEAITLGLNRLGHNVSHRPDGNSDFDDVLTTTDLVLLDLGLPGADGYEICRRIRTRSSIPIIILTARSDDIDTVAGLEAAPTTTSSNRPVRVSSTLASKPSCVGQRPQRREQMQYRRQRHSATWNWIDRHCRSARAERC